METKDRDELYAKYLPKIISLAQETTQKFQEKYHLFETLPLNDLSNYSMSLGYPSIFVPCFECAPIYVISLINELKHYTMGAMDKSVYVFKNYWIYPYPYGILFVLQYNGPVVEELRLAPCIHYNDLRAEIKKEVMGVSLDGIVELIVDYLILSTKGMKNTLLN